MNMDSKKLKIAIVVHGRFHAFDLARELIKLGHQVLLVTNYPYWTVKKFGVPQNATKTVVWHGILSRLIGFLHDTFGMYNCEPFLHETYSKYVSKIVKNLNYDVVYAFSGIAEELFKSRKSRKEIHALIRGSSHILTQSDILEAESRRVGVKIDKPSAWRIKRELREYELSDYVFVLSSFARNSFLAHGFSREKLVLLLSGVRLARFTAPKTIIEHRKNRVLSGAPLRVLTVGAFSFRKGARDLLTISQIAGDHFVFRFVGNILSETKPLLKQAKQNIELITKQDQFMLLQQYAWGDIFVFPTLEEGYPAVCAQAQASGLPIMITQNCSAPDIIENGKNGWIFPIQCPHLFIDQLQWCHTHREELANMIEYTYSSLKIRDFSDMAKDFESIIRSKLEEREKHAC